MAPLLPVGLADIYKRQIEIERLVSARIASPQAALVLGFHLTRDLRLGVRQAETSNDLSKIKMDEKRMYTTNGIHFFNTQKDLNQWIEEQKNIKPVVRVREMSTLREHSADVRDIYESIQTRLRLEHEKEEGIQSFPDKVEGHFCCRKHQGVFDGQVEEIVARDAVDYDSDFLLVSGTGHGVAVRGGGRWRRGLAGGAMKERSNVVLEHRCLMSCRPSAHTKRLHFLHLRWRQMVTEANKVHSTYLPGEIYAGVLVSLFQKYQYPFRQKLIDAILDSACLDDSQMFYNPDVIKKAAVDRLKARRRHSLLDLNASGKRKPSIMI